MGCAAVPLPGCGSAAPCIRRGSAQLSGVWAILKTPFLAEAHTTRPYLLILPLPAGRAAAPFLLLARAPPEPAVAAPLPPPAVPHRLPPSSACARGRSLLLGRADSLLSPSINVLQGITLILPRSMQCEWFDGGFHFSEDVCLG
jgi:hypothetical protein